MDLDISDLSNSELPNSLRNKFEEYDNDNEFIVNDNIFNINSKDIKSDPVIKSSNKKETSKSKNKNINIINNFNTSNNYIIYSNSKSPNNLKNNSIESFNLNKLKPRKRYRKIDNYDLNSSIINSGKKKNFKKKKKLKINNKLKPNPVIKKIIKNKAKTKTNNNTKIKNIKSNNNIDDICASKKYY